MHKSKDMSHTIKTVRSMSNCKEHQKENMPKIMRQVLTGGLMFLINKPNMYCLLYCNTWLIIFY